MNDAWLKSSLQPWYPNKENIYRVYQQVMNYIYLFLLTHKLKAKPSRLKTNEDPTNPTTQYRGLGKISSILGLTSWSKTGNDNEVKKSNPDPILKIQRFEVAKKTIDVASVCKVDNSPYSLQQNEMVP